jgi:hypothetical protein
LLAKSKRSGTWKEYTSERNHSGVSEDAQTPK